MPWPAIIAAGASLAAGETARAGGREQRRWQKEDLDRFYKWNEPSQQLARMRKAGLPMAALTGGGVSGGGGSLGGSVPDSGHGKQAEEIGKFSQRAIDLQQVELLKAETRNKNSEADVNEAKRDWFLSQAGNDSSNQTNLISGMKENLKASQLQNFATETANAINNHVRQNTPYRLNQENAKIDAEIARILKQNQLTDKDIKGKDISNAIGEIDLAFKHRMSLAQWKKLLSEKGLIDEKIESEKVNRAISEVERYVKANTAAASIMKAGYEALNEQLSHDRIGEMFRSYKAYQEFVGKAQKLFQADASNFDPRVFAERLAALAYTMSAEITGGAGRLLNAIR